MSAAGRPAHLTKLYQSYEASRSFFAIHLAKVFWTRARLSSWEGVRILDVGCGNGAIARVFASLGADVTAIDRNLRRMHRKLAEQPNFSLLAGDGHYLPLSEGSFDFAILSDVLEHAYDPARMVREVVRVVRPGGMAFVSATNRTSVANLVFDPHYNAPLIPLMSKRVATWYVTKLLKFNKSFSVETYFFRGQLVACLEAAGLACESLPIYQEKLSRGDLAEAPGRGILRKALSIPAVRRLAVWFAGTLPFEYFVAPGISFLCVRR